MILKHLLQKYSFQSFPFIEWSPVFLGCGIGVYFQQWGPPSVQALWWVAGSTLSIAALLIFVSRLRSSFLLKAFLFMLLGFLLTEAHRTALNHPRKAWRIIRPMKATLTGTVQEIAFRTARPTLLVGPPHMTLQFTTRKGKEWHFKNLQQRMRVLLKAEQSVPDIGDTISIPIFATPIKGKLTPNGFDFERYSYFNKIAGTGYSLGPVEMLNKKRTDHWAQRARQWVGSHIKKGIEGDNGAIAAALMIGDKSAIPIKIREAFVDAGIAHVLAISGLHLTLITGLFFFILRRMFCLIPPLALRYDTKKIAAIFALLGGGFYLMLANAPISTQRAFLMLALSILALWLDRPTFSRRFVMIAALVVLVVQPAALFMPSFHLSFFAVLALITVYSHLLEKYQIIYYQRVWWIRGLYYVQSLLIASFTASLATLPFTVYHFHKFTLQSLAANVAVIPLMSFWIMPLALLSLCLMPFGLEGPPLKAMSWGIDAMTQVAEKVSTWPGAVVRFPELPPESLGLMLLGSFLLYGTRGIQRSIGFLLLGTSFAGILWHNPPDVFVGEELGVIGVRHHKQLLVTAGRIPTFATRLWAESLGKGTEILAKWPKSDHGYIPIKTPCRDTLYTPKHSLSIGNLTITRKDTWNHGAHFVYCRNGKVVVRTAKSEESRWGWAVYAKAKHSQQLSQ